MDHVVLPYVFYRGDKYDETHLSPGLSRHDEELVGEWYAMAAQKPRFDEFLARGGVSWVDVPVSGDRRLHLRFRQVREGGLRGQNMALGIFYNLDNMKHINSLGDLASMLDVHLSPEGWNSLQKADELRLKVSSQQIVASLSLNNDMTTSEKFCYGPPQELHRLLSEQFHFKELESSAKTTTRKTRKGWFSKIGVAYNPPKSQKGIQFHAISRDFYLPSLQPWIPTEGKSERKNEPSPHLKIPLTENTALHYLKRKGAIVLSIFLGFGLGTWVTKIGQENDLLREKNIAEVSKSEAENHKKQLEKLKLENKQLRKDLEASREQAAKIAGGDVTSDK